MTDMNGSRMKFGVFMAPFHTPPGEDPTVAFQHDLETVQLLDRLDYDEAWFGEHHSGGSELFPDPAMFIAHAAPQTRRIKPRHWRHFPPVPQPTMGGRSNVVPRPPDARADDDGGRTGSLAHGCCDDRHRAG